MKKIWQKSLASMVSAALCLTAFVGCLTVNAATDYTGTINSNGVAVQTTATEAKLDVAVSVTIPNGTPGIAYTGLKATTEFGTLKGVEIKSGDVKVEELSPDGVTSIPAIDENGSFIIAAYDTSVGANDYVLTLTFAKNADLVLEDGATYPVTITYLGSQEVGAANWNEDPIGFDVAVKDITVTSAHTHTWGAGVMTTMPTTTSNGVITYTCGCGTTKQEAFSVSGTITTNTSKTSEDVDKVKVQYGAKFNSAVFADIQANGGTVTAIGMLFTKNGSDLDFSNEATKPVYEYTSTIPSGASPTLYYYYQGMTFSEMGNTLKFRAYVKFTFNGQDCYYYGDTYSKVFIDAISSNSDAQAQALVSLYNNKGTATNVVTSCTGTTLQTGNSNIITNSSRTQFDMVNVKVQYGAKFNSAVFADIQANGGTVTAIGMLFTRNGSDLDFSNEATKPVYEYTGTIPSGASPTLYYYYQGMPFSQMSDSLTFRPYVKYTNSEGTVSYEYGDTVSFVYIDLLASLASDNAYAIELLNYYNEYVVK